MGILSGLLLNTVYSGSAGVVGAIEGWSDGDACAGGGDVVIQFNKSVVFTEGAGPNGVSITATGGKTFTLSNATGTGTNKVTYVGAWSAAIIAGDIVNWDYTDSTGDYADADGNQMADNDLDITNCLGIGALTETTTGATLLETTSGLPILET